MNPDVTTGSPEETITFGRKLGEQLRGGEVLAICGPLGSGKTHLIKGIAAGLGAKEASREVNSPTFVIVNEYSGRVDIFHIDAYRLNSISEFDAIGFDDYCRPDAVVMIEWADKVRQALDKVSCIWFYLSHAGPSRRTIRIENLPGHIHL